MISETPVTPDATFLAGQKVAIVGRLGSVPRRQAHKLLRELGALTAETADATCALLVIGAEQSTDAALATLDDATRAAIGTGQIQLLTETELWQRLGLMESQHDVRRLYTPAMLAELIGVAVNVVRRWHRLGLIEPVREVQRLPYFDFAEVAVARQLKELVQAGASTSAIEKAVAEIKRRAPEVERPLAELSTVVEGKQLLLWKDDELIEPSGQRRFNFAAQTDDAPSEMITTHKLVIEPTTTATTQELLSYAAQLEENDQLAPAAEMLRAALAAGGPRADLCFQLAELLYRLGDLSAARERYYMAIELDENFIEARANLGCLLAELGERELAIAALTGALHHHPDYSDAHYQLARLFDDLSRREEAAAHWRKFLELSPDSPWSDEARERLGE